MTRHTRRRQEMNFRNVKDIPTKNIPIKENVEAFKEVGIIDNTLVTVNVFKFVPNTNSFLGNYRLQKKINKIKKQEGGRIPTFLELHERCKTRKDVRKLTRTISQDEDGRVFTYRLYLSHLVGFWNGTFNGKDKYTFYDKHDRYSA
ncbi:hypothetical protein KAMFAM_9 [Bacillus phage Kamfam]|nr:hypothetical protein OTK52_8 [Bacillus phage OTooleKemple52]AXQ67196.1 hypothetical protein KAMFAM_9 [Bacillus phage Kamfam]